MRLLFEIDTKDYDLNERLFITKPQDGPRL